MNYTIKNENLTVTLKTLSGTFASIKDADGREYLHQPDSFRKGQAPVCFPVCGGLRDFKAVTKSGKKIEMKRHGIVKDREFSLVEQTESSITFAFESDDEALAAFPFPFRLETSYRLAENKITVAYSVTNTGNETMPFMIGGHPAFACPIEEGEDYTDYQIDFEKDEDESTPTPVPATGLIDEEHRIPSQVKNRTLPLSHDLFHKYEIIYDALNSRQITLRKKDNPQRGLRLSFSGFSYLILWSSKNDGPFIAMEPWGGLSTCSDEDDVFENKRNCMFAEPGETKTLSFTVEILK
jgi:galactose mutarotase-like enzyme